MASIIVNRVVQRAMKDLAFLINGQTFLKSMGPLVYFSNKAGIRPHIIVAKERTGKPHDNINLHTLARLSKSVQDGRLYVVDRFQDIDPVLEQNDLASFVCQDAQHHAHELCEKYRAYSIGVFFDTVHHANNSTRKISGTRPHRMYYSDQYFKDEFERQMGETWNSGVVGAPHLDHAIFIEQKQHTQERVLFLTPIQSTLDQNTRNELEKFIEYCLDNHIHFIMKDRPKSKWIFNKKGLEEQITLVSHEEGFPYTSLSLILNTDLHITSYGTSAFEAQFFGRPVINMEVTDSDQLPLAIRLIKHSYDTDDIFNNHGLCQTVSSGLIDTYEDLKNRSAPPRRNLTIDDNFSLDILRDIAADL